MVGLGRPIDPADRAERALRAVRRALIADPDHLVVTGDLTEDGHKDQFAMLADVLEEAGVDPEATTLVAGNHDAYTEVDAFEQALRGPLQDFARTSTPGTAVLRGKTAIVALSTTMYQPILRAAGTLRQTDVEALRRWIGARSAEVTWLLTMHHGPWCEHPLLGPWVDGLIGQDALEELLHAHSNVCVLHGHSHQSITLRLRPNHAQVLCAPAVVDADDPLRLYRVGDHVVPVDSERWTDGPLVPAAA